MGICASCLGLRRRSSVEPSETEGLLYDDPLQAQYGTNAPGQQFPQPDPEELRREREVLERICAETSNELIDVLHHRTLTTNSKQAAEMPQLLNKHFAAHNLKSKTSKPTIGSESEDTRNGKQDTTNGTENLTSNGAETDAEMEEEDEEAWLNGTETTNWEEVKGLEPGALIINLNEPSSAPQVAAAKKTVR